MRALHTAATGMMAQELNVQVISNNIANMRTTGYKRQRAEFQDLLYEHVRRVGTQTSTQGNILPVGIDLGCGVKTVGTPRADDAGHDLADRRATSTSRSAAKASSRCRCRTARTAYTRDGSFQMDAQGRIVTAQGNVMQPGITIPQQRAGGHHQPAGPGVGDAARPDHADAVSARSALTRFINKAGLQAIGDNLFVETPASGTPQDGVPNTDGYRRPAAGQPRTGQRRGGHRDLRPDRRAARLRDERQGHHRRRPDAVGNLQPDALRQGHDPHRHRSRACCSRSATTPPPTRRPGRRGSRSSSPSPPRWCGSAISSRTPAPRPSVPIFRAPDLGQTGSVPVQRIAEALRPHDLAEPRHRRPERGRRDAAVAAPSPARMIDERDRARGRRPVRLRRGAEHRRHVRPRHPRRCMSRRPRPPT